MKTPAQLLRRIKTGPPPVGSGPIIVIRIIPAGELHGKSWYRRNKAE